MSDVIIIGAGFAGLTAAWQAAAKGHAVHVIAKGWGATHWLSGCIDVLGYYPIAAPEPIASPAEQLAALIAENPNHPYAITGSDRVVAALEAFQALCGAAGYPLHGQLDQNWLLPSAVGTARPTCLAPATMTAGDLTSSAPMLLVGFKQLADFYPALIADNLQQIGVPARHIMLDMPSLKQRTATAPAMLALLMERDDFQAELASLLSEQLGDAARIGFPAVLGQKPDLEVKEALENRLQRPVFEIPSLTPSIAGMRLQAILVNAIRAHGGRVTPGMEAVGAAFDQEQVTAVYTETPIRQTPHQADTFVLATGGILGGGITTDYSGSIREQVFDLPVVAPENHTHWFHLDFLDERGHPIYRSGVAIDGEFRPLNGDKEPVFDNLRCVGTTLAHAEVIRERSFEGVAIATGYAAVQTL